MLIKAQNKISRNENYNFKIKISLNVLDIDKEAINELEERLKKVLQLHQKNQIKRRKI